MRDIYTNSVSTQVFLIGQIKNGTKIVKNSSNSYCNQCLGTYAKHTSEQQRKNRLCT